MRFDPTITLGTLLNLVTVVVGVALLWGRFRSLETKVDAMWRWFMKQMNQIGDDNPSS